MKTIEIAIELQLLQKLELPLQFLMAISLALSEILNSTLVAINKNNSVSVISSDLKPK